MMSKYLEIEMEPTKSGIGGSFITTASFRLDNIISPFRNIPVKIDTGCSISTVPLARFQMLRSFCDSLKEKDIINHIPYQISYGVETGGRQHGIPQTYDAKMSCEALKFEHAISEFEIAGVPISQKKIYINYNRHGNILIGMDILSNWNIHIGRNHDNGKVMLIGCPRELIDEEYINLIKNRLESELTT